MVLSKEFAQMLTQVLEKSHIEYTTEKHKNTIIVFADTKSRDKNKVCDILADAILNGYIKRHINSYLDKEFYFFEKNEKIRLCDSVLSKLKKDEISDKLTNFFDEKDEIILDGFLKFRMKKYVDYVDCLISEYADKMISEKETDEFARLLKYFVSIGDMVCDTAHIFSEEGDYVITDENGNLPVDMTGVMYEFSDMECLPEDELLGSLVSIAPKKIVMHGKNISETDENMSIILKVFGDRMEFCGGKCEKCRGIKD